MSGKVVLIYPATGIDVIVNMPFSVLNPASYLANNGYDVSIIDQRVLRQDTLKKIEEEVNAGPLCIGISTMTGPQIKNALKIIEFIRTLNSGVPVVLGGVHPTLLPDETLQHEGVDIVVRGEGEETLLELVRAIETKDSLGLIEGISYRSNGQIKHNPDRAFLDMTKMPRIPYELLDVPRYLRNTAYGRYVAIHTSTGCPHDCGFCLNAVFNESRWRARAVQSIIEDIKYFRSNHSVDMVGFVDDNFFVSKRRVEELLGGFEREGLKVSWTADCRVDYFLRFSDDFVKRLCASGLKGLYIGLESGSDRMLKFIKKGITVEDILEANRRLSRFNITPCYSLMLGIPGESMDEIHQTVRLIERVIEENPQCLISMLKCYIPYPGTDLYDLSTQSGFEPPRTFEEWGNLGTWYDCSFPWLRDQKQRLENICFISRFLATGKTGNKKIDLLASLYRPVARLRWKFRMFSSFLDTMMFSLYFKVKLG